MNEKTCGYPCYRCQKFYETEQDASTCRHDQKYLTTPSDFWRTDFPATQEILENKLMLTENDPLPEHAKPKWMKQKESRMRSLTSCDGEKDDVVVSKSDSSTSTNTEEASPFSPPSKKQFYSTRPERHGTPVVLVADTSSSSSAGSSYIYPLHEQRSVWETNSECSMEKTILKLQPVNQPENHPTVTYDCVFEGNTIMIIKDSSSVGIDDTAPDVIIEELSPSNESLKKSFECLIRGSASETETSPEKSSQPASNLVEEMPVSIVSLDKRGKKRKQRAEPVHMNIKQKEQSKVSTNSLREAAAMYSGFQVRSQHPSKKLRSHIKKHRERNNRQNPAQNRVVVLSDDEADEEEIVNLSSSDDEASGSISIDSAETVRVETDRNKHIPHFIKERSIDLVPVQDMTISRESVSTLNLKPKETLQLSSDVSVSDCRQVKQVDVSDVVSVETDANVDVSDEINNVVLPLPSNGGNHQDPACCVRDKTSNVDTMSPHSDSLSENDGAKNDFKPYTTQHSNKKKKKRGITFYQGTGAFLSEFITVPRKGDTLMKEEVSRHNPAILGAEVADKRTGDIVGNIDEKDAETNSNGNCNKKQVSVEVEKGRDSQPTDITSSNQEVTNQEVVITEISAQLTSSNQELTNQEVGIDEISAQLNNTAEGNGEESNVSVNRSDKKATENVMAAESMDATNEVPSLCERFVEYKNFDKPKEIAYSVKEFRNYSENCLRGCKWSPDGASILTNSDDNMIRLFTLPEHHPDGSPVEMSSNLRMKEGGTIYDFDWYPYMDSSNPDTCCFLTTSKDHPVHLWDSVTGRIRCSYRAYDHLDELVSCNCAQFNLDGSKIYCGFNKIVRVFESSRPGREFTEIHTVAKKNGRRKSKPRFNLNVNQTGIISCLAFSACYTGLLAMGSFSKSIGLYSTDDNKLVHLLDQQVGGHVGGVTQLKFTDDGCFLFSGGRKDPEIICWDMRNTTMPLFKLRRDVRTNQRIQFDIDRAGGFVVSGNTNKMVSVYDLNPIFENISDEVVIHEQSGCFQAHHDAVNAVSLNPCQPILATASGQRHFYIEDTESGDETTECVGSRVRFDNSLKLWKL